MRFPSFTLSFFIFFIIYFIFYLLFLVFYLERKTIEEPSRSLSAIAEFLVEVEYLKNGAF